MYISIYIFLFTTRLKKRHPHTSMSAMHQHDSRSKRQACPSTLLHKASAGQPSLPWKPRLPQEQLPPRSKALLPSGLTDMRTLLSLGRTAQSEKQNQQHNTTCGVCYYRCKHTGTWVPLGQKMQPTASRAQYSAAAVQLLRPPPAALEPTSCC